jgi:hypothetical protein
MTCTLRNKKEGGRRKGSKARGTKKAHTGARKGMMDWNKKVMKVYHEMKAKNPKVMLRDAMKEASSRKKKGQL